MTNIQKQDYYFVEILHQAKECFLLFLSVSYLPLRLNVPFLMYLQPLRSSPCIHRTYR